MADLKVIVFNVERGLCVFARTPTGYGVMIDCGRSRDFSPAAWIAKHEAPWLTPWSGHSLYKLIVTHPHDDHVEDIETVKRLLPPAVLSRHKDYDWQAVLNPPDCDPSLNARNYYQWQQTYSHPITSSPDLGLQLQTFALSPAEAAAINANSQQLLNNSSYVTILTYQPRGVTQAWKVVVAGDNETAGWQKLLGKTAFREAILGADFYVTAHHGHKSGFAPELFQVMGKPILNITSERSGDTSGFDYGPYATGAIIEGVSRSHLTTRWDEHITLTLKDTMRYSIEVSE